ncbi:MYCT protein, partial [Vireo altiloquus]|nr:MYCT protein [Vireo altiloquus]
SATILQMSGVEDDRLAIWLAALTAFINFIFTLVGVWLVERMGRRKLTLGSLTGEWLFVNDVWTQSNCLVKMVFLLWPVAGCPSAVSLEPSCIADCFILQSLLKENTNNDSHEIIPLNCLEFFHATFDLGSGGYVFSLARGQCNGMIITKSTDGFVFHVEFSHGVNMYYCSTLVCISKDITIYAELLLAASLVFGETRYAPSIFSTFTKTSRVDEKADATFCFTEKPASLGAGVKRSMVISKSLINFTFTTLFSTPEMIIPGIFLRFSSQLLRECCMHSNGVPSFPSRVQFNRELFNVLWRKVSHCSLSVFLGTAVALIILASGFLLSAQVSPRITLNPPDPSHQNSTCTKYSYCSECMLDPDCGLCYKLNESSVVQSSCIPVDKDSTMKAAWGRCSNETVFKKEDLFWAYNFCPTPYSWTALLGLILYLVFFAPGMGPMPWTVNSEIYPLWARSTGNACSSGVNWVFNVLVSLTFLHTAEYLTYYGAFLLYAGLAALGLVFIYGCLPETKGKKLEEIESLFENRLCTCGMSDSDEGRYIEYIRVKGSNYHLSDNDASDVE